MTSRAVDFVRLFVQERQRLLRGISHRVDSPATAADLVQDVFLRLWERGGKVTGDPSAYLFRSIRNAVIDHRRAERVRASALAALLPEQLAAAPPPALGLLEARQQLERVDGAIRALPERSRDIFLLNRVHGRSYAEIGRALGLSPTAVEKHMARALAACRAAMDPPA